MIGYRAQYTVGIFHRLTIANQERCHGRQSVLRSPHRLFAVILRFASFVGFATSAFLGYTSDSLLATKEVRYREDIVAFRVSWSNLNEGGGGYTFPENMPPRARSLLATAAPFFVRLGLQREYAQAWWCYDEFLILSGFGSPSPAYVGIPNPFYALATYHDSLDFDPSRQKGTFILHERLTRPLLLMTDLEVCEARWPDDKGRFSAPLSRPRWVYVRQRPGIGYTAYKETHSNTQNTFFSAAVWDLSAFLVDPSLRASITADDLPRHLGEYTNRELAEVVSNAAGIPRSWIEAGADDPIVVLIKCLWPRFSDFQRTALRNTVRILDGAAEGSDVNAVGKVRSLVWDHAEPLFLEAINGWLGSVLLYDKVHFSRTPVDYRLLELLKKGGSDMSIKERIAVNRMIMDMFPGQSLVRPSYEVLRLYFNRAVLYWQESPGPDVIEDYLFQHSYWRDVRVKGVGSAKSVGSLGGDESS